MDINRLLEQLAETRRSLFAEGYLNDNFTYLEEFEKEFRMEFFVHEALDTYFEESAPVLAQVEQELVRVPHDFGMLETLLAQIWTGTITVGANKVTMKVNPLRDLVRRRNSESCHDAFRELKLEYERFKSRMELYFRMKEWNPPEEIYDDHGCDDETSDEDN